MGRVGELVDRVGILRPLRIRDFAFLWIGLTVSFIGDGVYIIAIAWQTYDLSNSPSALAAVGIAWSLPQVILLLITGVLSDRVDRRLLMIAGDVIRGAAIATIGIMSIGGTLTMTWLIGLVVVYGAGQALFGPAFSSIVPQVVPEELLVEANSLGQFVRPVAWTLIGPLVGGALVASVGTGWAFIADASTFAVSAVMVGVMRTRPEERSDDERTSPWADLKEGLRYVRSKTWLWVAMLTGTRQRRTRHLSVGGLLSGSASPSRAARVTPERHRADGPRRGSCNAGNRPGRPLRWPRVPARSWPRGRSSCRGR